MILGYGIIAVPTGIVSSEMTKTRRLKMEGRRCHECMFEGHDADAKFCQKCGFQLN